MRGLGLLVVLAGLAGALLHRRTVAQRNEHELWTEAGIAPDLR